MRQGWESEAQNWLIFARTPGYDSSHAETNLPVLLDLLPPPGHRTLDLACGEGRLSRFLTTLGHNVVGADASPAMVRGAATHQDASPVLLADATQLPFADASFDLVVAYMCLHDIDDMPGAVREAARVLAPAGRLCASIPHPLNTAGTFQGGDADAPFDPGLVPGSGSAADAGPAGRCPPHVPQRAPAVAGLHGRARCRWLAD